MKLRRAIVVLMSGQGQAVRDISSLLRVSAHHVRDVIHAAVSEETLRRILRAGGRLVADHDHGGKPPRTRTSSPRCTESWTSTTTRPPAGGWCASTSSGR